MKHLRFLLCIIFLASVSLADPSNVTTPLAPSKTFGVDTLSFSTGLPTISIPLRSRLGVSVFLKQQTQIYAPLNGLYGHKWQLDKHTLNLPGFANSHGTLQADTSPAMLFLDWDQTDIVCPDHVTHTIRYDKFRALTASGDSVLLNNLVVPGGEVYWDSQGCYSTSVELSDSDGRGLIYDSTLGFSLYDTKGNTFTGKYSTAAITDSNGNALTRGISGLDLAWTDALGTVFLSAHTPSALDSGGGTGADDTYSYTDADGNNRVYTVHYTGYYFATNFGCGNIADTTDTSLTYLPTSVDVPDGSHYYFTYEQTAGKSSQYKTGRLASLTLPTGGVITYSYSGGTNGVNCSVDNSTAIVTRSFNDGQAEAWSVDASTQGSSTVTDPVGNQTLVFTSVVNEWLDDWTPVLAAAFDVEV